MTTLTRILLNPARRKARQYLTDPNSMHAAVRGAFPPDLDQEESRILWRIDHRGHEHVLYIVGPEKPTADAMVEDAGWDTRPAQIADYDRFLNRITRGQRWWFELVANPTYSESRGPGKRGKVKAHISAQHQLDWLGRKSRAHGFAIETEGENAVAVVGRGNLDFRRRNTETRERRDRVKIVTARFQGVLEVTDADELRHTLVNGIGRSKGYGCGLLTLAPLRNQHD